MRIQSLKNLQVRSIKKKLLLEVKKANRENIKLL